MKRKNPLSGILYCSFWLLAMVVGLPLAHREVERLVDAQDRNTALLIEALDRNTEALEQLASSISEPALRRVR